MKNDSSMAVLWIAVGSLALATMVLVSNYQKTSVVSQISSAQNTAIVSTVRRDCFSAVAPLDSLCESLSGQERYCCTLFGQIAFAYCMGGSLTALGEYYESQNCSAY